MIRERGGRTDDEPLARARATYGADAVVAHDKRAWSVGGVFIEGFGTLWARVRPRRLTGSPSVSLFERHRFSPTAVMCAGAVKLPVSRLVMQRVVWRSLAR